VTAGTCWNVNLNASSPGVWIIKTDARGNLLTEPTWQTAGRRRHTVDVGDWGESFVDWFVTLEAGQRYRYSVNLQDKGGPARSGWLDLSIADRGLAVAVNWSVEVGGESSTGSAVVDPADGLYTLFHYDDPYVRQLFTDEECVRWALWDSHMDNWFGGTWELVDRYTSLPNSPVLSSLSVEISGRTYAGIEGAAGHWERYREVWFSEQEMTLGLTTYGDFCMNANVPLPLYFRIEDSDGCREYTLVGVDGF